MRNCYIMLGKMIVIAAVLTGCSTDASTGETDELSLPQEAKKVIVETDVIKHGDLLSEKRISGQVISNEETDVYTNVGGKITQMAFKEGQVVQKGQVIAKLDSEEQLSLVEQSNETVTQAQAGIDQAMQQLENAEIGKQQAVNRHDQVKLAFGRLEEKYNKSQKDQGENEESTPQGLDLEELKTQWESAVKNYEKSLRLYEKEIIPRKELEQSKEQEESARRNYEKGLLAVKESSKELEGTIENDKINLLTSEMELKQADLTVGQAKIALQQAKNALQKAQQDAVRAKGKLNELEVRAPFTGVLKKIHVKEAGYVAQQSPIVTMFNHEQLKVIASVYPSQKKDFSVGQKLKIQGVNNEAINEGEIIHISPYVDEKGFFQMEASILGDQTNYIAGEYIELLIETIADKNQLLVPTKAIIEKDEKAFVYLIKNSKAIYKEVEVLQMQTDWTSVKGDLKQGEEIAVKGMVLLSDGMDVENIHKKDNKKIDKNDSSKEKDGESE